MKNDFKETEIEATVRESLPVYAQNFYRFNLLKSDRPFALRVIFEGLSRSEMVIYDLEGSHNETAEQITRDVHGWLEEDESIQAHRKTLELLYARYSEQVFKGYMGLIEDQLYQLEINTGVGVSYEINIMNEKTMRVIINHNHLAASGITGDRRYIVDELKAELTEQDLIQYDKRISQAKQFAEAYRHVLEDLTNTYKEIWQELIRQDEW